MNTNIVIGCFITVIILVIIIIVMKKKEHFNTFGVIASSGTGTPSSPNNYLFSDQGNISVSTNGIFNNLDVEGNISLKGYSGNMGDVMVSNGSSSPPVWAGLGNIPKLIAYQEYSLPVIVNAGNQIVSVPINTPINPNMLIIVDMTLTASTSSGGGIYAIGINASLGDQVAQFASGVDNYGRYGWTTNAKFIFSGVSGNNLVLNVVNGPAAFYFVQPDTQTVKDHVLVYAVDKPQ